VPGTSAQLHHDAGGYSIAFLMNTQGGPQPLFLYVIPVLTQALGTAFQGSATDLYPNYPSPSLPASQP
jgi:hypothetical protein